MPGFFQVCGEIASQLREPRAARVPGDAQQVDPAGLVLDHESDIQPGQGERAVYVEQVDRQDGPGVGAQERAPLVIADGRRRDPPAAQDLAGSCPR